MSRKSSMSESKLIDKIEKEFPEAKPSPASTFAEGYEGIWFRGSEDSVDHVPIFDYWNEMTVHPKLSEILMDAGWYSEPYDAGTLMAFPDW
jgi:hypothetical protein|tara:strand:+ start:4107 stop:4379 length:273 start_codon:yes stop_codon:yes gene_type:complete